MDYVVAAANLYAQIYGIQGTGDRVSIRQILDNFVVPPFAPKSSVRIHLTDEEMEEDKKCDDSGESLVAVCLFVVNLILVQTFSPFRVFAPEKARLEELKECLSSSSARASAQQMYPTDFEKVKQVCWETSAAHAAETTDRLAAQG